MQDQKAFVIVVPSYNNAKFYQKNLASALYQEYENFRIIYTDDASPDGTGKLVENYLKSADKRKRVSLNQNESRLGALHNFYSMIHTCRDDEIVVVLDGDDWFAHSKVLSVLNRVYSSSDVWVTYGQYKSHPDGRLGCSRDIPMHVKQSNSYRRFRWCSSHLRTFYAGLFKKINKEDLMDGDKFFSMTGDLAVMFPLLEMSGTRNKFISEVLYTYNCQNPINDSKVDIKLQQSLEMKIRNKRPYAPLKEAMW